MTTHNNSGLSTEGAMTLSQSMDSVNTTPEEEVSFVVYYLFELGLIVLVVRSYTVSVLSTA